MRMNMLMQSPIWDKRVRAKDGEYGSGALDIKGKVTITVNDDGKCEITPLGTVTLTPKEAEAIKQP